MAKEKETEVKEVESVKIYKFKNSRRVVQLGSVKIDSDVLAANQWLAQVLIDKGMSDLLC